MEAITIYDFLYLQVPSSMNFPIESLETDRLRLVSPDVKYAQDVYDYSKDSEFCRFIDAPPASNLAESAKFIESLIQEAHIKKRFYWLIIEKNLEKAIGTLGFIFSSPRHHGVFDFGYGLSRKHWGTGLFQEASNAVLKYGFNSLHAQRIQIYTREDNTASIKSVQKLGFKKEAVLEDFYQTNEGRINSVLLRLLKDEFLKRQ
ncbi:MAG: GNAT family N-acetyltransferase [Desulfobacterales bacterium]|nr:GNAT family N-acetyltransferase [Desulfobacterales bacterium]